MINALIKNEEEEEAPIIETIKERDRILSKYRKMQKEAGKETTPLSKVQDFNNTNSYVNNINSNDNNNNPIISNNKNINNNNNNNDNNDNNNNKNTNKNGINKKNGRVNPDKNKKNNSENEETIIKINTMKFKSEPIIGSSSSPLLSFIKVKKKNTGSCPTINNNVTNSNSNFPKKNNLMTMSTTPTGSRKKLFSSSKSLSKNNKIKSKGKEKNKKQKELTEEDESSSSSSSYSTLPTTVLFNSEPLSSQSLSNINHGPLEKLKIQHLQSLLSEAHQIIGQQQRKIDYYNYFLKKTGQNYAMEIPEDWDSKNCLINEQEQEQEQEQEKGEQNKLETGIEMKNKIIKEENETKKVKKEEKKKEEQEKEIVIIKQKLQKYQKLISVKDNTIELFRQQIRELRQDIDHLEKKCTLYEDKIYYFKNEIETLMQRDEIEIEERKHNELDKYLANNSFIKEIRKNNVSDIFNNIMNTLNSDEIQSSSKQSQNYKQQQQQQQQQQHKNHSHYQNQLPSSTSTSSSSHFLIKGNVFSSTESSYNKNSKIKNYRNNHNTNSNSYYEDESQNSYSSSNEEYIDYISDNPILNRNLLNEKNFKSNENCNTNNINN